MANVQLENGYIRVATELMDEIIRRDFSKRQLAILHFIIRLSYGCQKKDCVVEKLIDFEIAGIHKSDIKKELNYLCNTKVIIWDQENNLFSLNKDYEKWQINPSKGWDEERMDSLLHQNIKRKKVGETPTIQKIEVGKTPTNLGETVGKTPTTRLVKHQLEGSEIPWESKGEEPRKDSIKDIYLKITKEEEEITTVERILKLLEKSKILDPNDITEFLRDDIDDVINNFGFEQPEEMIIEAIKDAARGNGRTWKYVYKKLVAWKKKGFKTPSDLDEDAGQEVSHGATIHQYRRGHVRSAKESRESITGGKVGRL